MPRVESIKFNIDKVFMDTTGIGELFGDLIKNASDFSKVDIEELKFYCTVGKGFDIDSILTIKDMIANKIRINDFVIAKNLIKGGRMITWQTDDDEWDYKESDYAYSLVYMIFMFVTRDKIRLEKGETIPRILSNNFPSSLTVIDILRILSANNHDKMNMDWILKFDISCLGEIIKNRLLKGVAGCRLLQSIVKYDTKLSITVEHKLFIEALRSKFMKGVFIEMHTRGQPLEIKNNSLMKNLSNFMLINFDMKVLNQMKLDKVIFEIPKRYDGYNWYLSWTDQTLDYMKTPWLMKE